MIISRTPFRMSLFGGGTDYPDWYLENGGMVLGATIDKYCYLSVRYLPPFFEHKHRVVWSEIELVNNIDEIRHPAVKAILEEMKFIRGLEISYNADLPARSGLGSSSAFTVGLINALTALRGKMISKKALAQDAIRIEQEVIGEAVGSQDQIWAAYGGLNKIEFQKDGKFSISPIIMGEKNYLSLESSLMLFFTGFSRVAPLIAQKKIDNFKNKEEELNMLSTLASSAASSLQDKNYDIKKIGELIHEAWILKRELAEGVTTKEIDEIYKEGLLAGALGGKILGAGGGGFILFVVPPENQANLQKRLSKLVHVKFNFDSVGSNIVVFEPEDE
jgi:D-glycero-alpha-D-manno-heptose-7-phosphate kinase|tara:strand:+ start:1137 stop:2132 length:996 start_codon:yes stop_codon:yes gene_type:complete